MTKLYRKQIYLAQGGRFLRPQSVGSGVHWYISLEEREYTYEEKKGQKYTNLAGKAVVADCDNRIQWYLNDAGDLAKLNAAIEELTAARNALASALDRRDAHRKKYKLTDDDEDESL